MRTPVKPPALGLTLLLPLAAMAAEPAPASDMELIEFLGSLETDSDSGREILTAIDAGLLPDLPEEPSNDESK